MAIVLRIDDLPGGWCLVGRVFEDGVLGRSVQNP